MNVLLILFGKLLSMVSRFLNVGSGSTWPGHIALNVNKNFIKELINANSQLKIILIAGTNGKTTTGKLIQTILGKANYKVFQNESGANLLNGIASSLLLRSSILSTINYDYAIFEVDEATLPLALKEIIPDYLILLNLFRDQLDRYGEVNTIVEKWRETIQHLLPKTKLILNADDPQIAYLCLKSSVIPAKAGIQKDDWMPDQVGHDKDSRTILYFGLSDKRLAQTQHQHAVDSTYCPNCNSKLFYNTIYYSHLGDWECKKCSNKRPKNIFSNPPPSKLSGSYNLYNILAAVLVSKNIGVSDEIIHSSLKTFTPAFGRQEILNISGKKVQIFLSKNPTSFNESLRTIADLKAPARNATQSVAGGKNVLLVLNDRIPDGRDVSWIWDVDTEEYIKNFNSIIISGDRAFDMGLRIKYSSEFSISNFQFSMKTSNLKFQIEEDLKKAISLSLKKSNKSETLYILPTYSAMLEVRKILMGRKIL